MPVGDYHGLLGVVGVPKLIWVGSLGILEGISIRQGAERSRLVRRADT